MGDNEYYICLKCSAVEYLEPYEALLFLENHWGHPVLRVFYDTGDRLTPRAFQVMEAEG